MEKPASRRLVQVASVARTSLQILRRARDVDRETLAGNRNGREQRQSEGEGRKTQGRRGEGEAELRQKMEPAKESFRETCCCREALASRSAEQHLSRDAVRLGRRPGGRASHVPRSPLHSRRNAQLKRRGSPSAAAALAAAAAGTEQTSRARSASRTRNQRAG